MVDLDLAHEKCALPALCSLPQTSHGSVDLPDIGKASSVRRLNPFGKAVTSCGEGRGEVENFVKAGKGRLIS